MNDKSHYQKERVESRRLFLKSPLLLIFGTSASLVSTSAKADPIKLIVDAMAMAAKFVLDVAIDMVEGLLDNLLDSFMSQDGEKVGKIGDGLNTVSTEIFNGKVQRDTAPPPRNCNQIYKTKVAETRRANDKSLYEELSLTSSTTSNNSIVDALMGRDHDYGRTFVNWLREKGVSTSTVGANSNKMTFSISGLFKDGYRFATQEDKDDYIKTIEIMSGPTSVPELRPLDNGGSSVGLNRQIIHKQEARLAVQAIAIGNFYSDIRISDSSKYEALHNEIKETYHSQQWRNETTAIASPVPNAINLINLNSTKIELLFEMLLQLDKTILLKSAKIARGLNRD